MPCTEEPTESFLRSSSEERVTYVFLDMLAERTARLEKIARLDELHMLRMENQRLAQRMAEREIPDMEVLVAFLPIIFRNVWGQVRVNDVAMLAHSYKMPIIRSPYPEPTPREIQLGRQLLSQSSEEERRTLLQACRTLLKNYPRLVVRSEMQDFLMGLF